MQSFLYQLSHKIVHRRYTNIPLTLKREEIREDPTPKELEMFTNVHDGYFTLLAVTVRTTNKWDLSNTSTKRWKQNILLETSSGKFVNLYFLTSEMKMNQMENILLFPHKNAC